MPRLAAPPLRSLALLGAVLAFAAPARAQRAGPDFVPLRPPVASFTLVLPLGAAEGRPPLTQRQLIEMGAVALTGLGHLVFAVNDASAYFIPLAVGGWGGYVGYRALTEPEFLRDAGFTGRALGPAFRGASLVAGAATAGMLAVGAVQGTLRLDADVLPLLVLYPAWGLTQQFLVQGLITRPLAGAGVSPWAVTPVSAATFGAVHVPNWELTAATTVLGAAWAGLYQRHGNLWPLGLYHGVLGAEFYVWVLGRNPWQELLGNEEAPE